MPRILTFATGPNDWQGLLADPVKHWRSGLRHKNTCLPFGRILLTKMGLTSDFAIVREFTLFKAAQSQLNPLAEEFMTKELAENPGWFSMDIGGKEKPQWYEVNMRRRVLARESFKAGDGTGFNSTYVYLEVIKTLSDELINEGLFNFEDCHTEVRRYFVAQARYGIGQVAPSFDPPIPESRRQLSAYLQRQEGRPHMSA